jgi:hypothetical protein
MTGPKRPSCLLAEFGKHLICDRLGYDPGVQQVADFGTGCIEAQDALGGQTTDLSDLPVRLTLGEDFGLGLILHIGDDIDHACLLKPAPETRCVRLRQFGKFHGKRKEALHIVQRTRSPGHVLDKGDHSPANQKALAEIISDICLPNSGDKALAKQFAEATVSWAWQRRHHSGIEAAIVNLQDNSGCRRCPDNGKDGYDRFLQTAVHANNLVTYGRLLWAQDDPESLPART